MMKSRSWLVWLLLVSYGLRVWLACLGGEGFWPDEDRYSDGRYAAADLLHGKWSEAARQLLHSDHTLFRWFALPPGLFETLAGPHPAAVASYFSLFSVLAIFLVWTVARRAGAGEAEALWAAYLAACANSLFYYSRHFFPYDISLCAMLGGLCVALGPWSWRRSLLVGVVAGVGFLTYNGYWLLGGCVLILHALLGDGGKRRFLARAALSGSGLLLAILPVVGLARMVGTDLVAEDYKWGAIAKGDFPFAHRVIPGYLWFGEGGLLVVWLAAFGFALMGAWRDRRWGRLGWYAGGLALVGGGLLFMSDVWPLFAVQGRRVRCVVPFLCLGAAVGIGRFLAGRERNRRGWTIAIALLVFALAARNFSGPLRQIFPAEFQRRSARIIAQDAGYAAYRIAFGESLWGLPLDPILPASPPLLRSAHPLQFRPYQYEGYDTAQRAEINRHDVAMRLLRIPADLGPAVRQWGGYPGPVRWSVIFPTDRETLAEPLVTSGEPGRGDFLFVRYLDRRHIAFGLDHWGSGAGISVPVELDYAKPHEIVISLGSLLPPAEAGLDPKFPQLARWRDQVLVVFDGRVVFRWKEAAWPARPDQVMFGVNLIHGTSVQLSFSGQVLKLDSAPGDGVAAAMKGPAVGGLAETSWIRDWARGEPLEVNRADDAGLSLRSIPGRSERVVAVSFRLPPRSDQRGQPVLVFSGADGRLGLLAMRRAAAGLEVGWRDGEGWWWSGPLTTAAADLHTVEVQWSRAEATAAPPASERSRRLAAMIMIDGILYPHPRPQFFDAPDLQVATWRDPVADAAPYFTGEVEDPPAIQPLPLVSDGGPASRHFRLAVRFPTDRPGRNEPLVIAGRQGAADGLFVHYERPGWVRIGFDHWGVGGPLAAPVRAVEGAYQILEVELGAGGWSGPPGRDVRVFLGGQPILRASSDLYSVAAADVAIGQNNIGLSTSDPAFSGTIFPLEDSGAAP